MQETSLARFDSFHLAWALGNFEYIYTLEALCQTSEGITSNSMLLGGSKISVRKIESYL